MVTHHAPDIESMIEACQDAFRHRRLQCPGDTEVTILVDPVPHFVPGMGISGEWYRVGALRLIGPDRYLTVFMDAVTGQVEVEQITMQVARQPASRRGPATIDLHRWENDGGATHGRSQLNPPRSSESNQRTGTRPRG